MAEAFSRKGTTSCRKGVSVTNLSWWDGAATKSPKRPRWVICRGWSNCTHPPKAACAVVGGAALASHALHDPDELTGQPGGCPGRPGLGRDGSPESMTETCFLHDFEPPPGNRSATTGNHGRNILQVRNKVMQERCLRHESDLVGWCCDQVPKTPQMGHLQGVVKLHASAKAACAPPEYLWTQTVNALQTLHF